MLAECKVHIDVFVEAHPQFVCHANNKKINMAGSPVQREQIGPHRAAATEPSRGLSSG